MGKTCNQVPSRNNSAHLHMFDFSFLYFPYFCGSGINPTGNKNPSPIVNGESVWRKTKLPRRGENKRGCRKLEHCLKPNAHKARVFFCIFCRIINGTNSSHFLRFKWMSIVLKENPIWVYFILNCSCIIRVVRILKQFYQSMAWIVFQIPTSRFKSPRKSLPPPCRLACFSCPICPIILLAWVVSMF